MPSRLQRLPWPLLLFALAFGGLFAWLYHWRMTHQQAAAAKLPDDKVVLARVGKTTITELDLSLAAEVGFSKKSRRVFEGEARKQLLESLIQARAIALARESELTPDEKLELEKLVEREREDILIKQYLRKHAKPDLVSSKAMREYYEAHREEFGAAPARVYEIMAAEARLAGPERDEVIRELGKAAATSDWLDWTQKLRAKGKPILHYRGDLALKLMKPQLAAVAERLKPGQASEVTMIDGRPHVVRLISSTPGIAKPYESVADEIRERLSPALLTKAAAEAASEATKKVEIVRY